MDKSKMVRKLKLFSIIGLSTTLLIGCGDGFRAATYDKAVEVTKEKSVQEQILEKNAEEKAERERVELEALERDNPSGREQTKPESKPDVSIQPAPAPAAAPAAPKPEEKITQDELKVFEETVTPLEAYTLENVKEAMTAIKPELASYLQGLTITVRQVEEKKIDLEVLAVISKTTGRISRLLARQEIAFPEGEKANKVVRMKTEQILMSSMMGAHSEEDMYKPSTNSKVGFVCADAKCETAYLLVRSAVKKANKTEMLAMIVELKRHDGRFEITRTNASDKPLLIKSYHDAE